MLNTEISAKDALRILQLFKFFHSRISKERILEVWKNNKEKNYDELKNLLQEELEEAA